MFWRHSNCPVKFKSIAIDAVLRSRLLYGLETAQLNEPQTKRLDIFQLKALRKVLNLKTTFTNRGNTNKHVFEQANERIRQEGGKKKVVPFRKAYMCSKMKQIKRLINQSSDEPTRAITFRRGLETWQQPNRRPGRPKNKWANRALIELWDEIKELQPTHRTTEFDSNNTDIQNRIKEYAKDTQIHCRNG